MAGKKKESAGRKKTKDHILQARIPKDLDDELRDRAEELGLSVSTIVRNVLLNTFDLVENVVSDSAQLAKAIKSNGAQPAALTAESAQTNTGHDGSIIGWQEATLNCNGVCDHCNTIMKKGELGAIGMPVQVRPVFLCLNCIGKLKASDTQSDH